MVEDMVQTKCLGGKLGNIIAQAISLAMMFEHWPMYLGTGCEGIMMSTSLEQRAQYRALYVRLCMADALISGVLSGR